MSSLASSSRSRRSLRAWAETPVGRGTILLGIASFCFGFALNAQQSVVSNFFEDDIGLRGPQFGYITAIREVPGFLLIFLTALFYRLSLPKLTFGALLVLAVGYSLFGWANSFWTVTPWVVISSIGYHTWLQTQSALGLSLAIEEHSGRVLGQMTAIMQGGSLLAMATVLISFHEGWLTFDTTFLLCGVMALLAAIAIYSFPSLRNGEAAVFDEHRQPIVFKRDYRLYYALNFLDGARQQIFFSFGLWVLIHQFNLGVTRISAVLLVTTTLAMFLTPRIGRALDRYGERHLLLYVNISFVVALLGYALVRNVWIATLCYVIYAFIAPLATMCSTVYLRKIAPTVDLAPSLAMGLTMQHAAAVIVPVVTGFILNYVGYEIPFLVAAGFAVVTLLVSRRLDAGTQKSPAKREEERQAIAVAKT